ncbi:uncharacterized protein LOC126370360 [Pectinophora gossypiella]|uniref:uncharacterized protein LOC126370360 n=1 Tax=Pectinophora gossypiella TaxID=13191 RepID=UPI00214E8202|nr:uncharacterized protein LOC126370360 [Pectinophora gossypiella]
MAGHRYLLANVNHCTGAQDLVMQTMLQGSNDVLVITEPYYVSPQPNWVGDTRSSVVIIVATGPGSMPLSVRDREPGFVSALWGDNLVFGVYFSPNVPLAEYQLFLDRLGIAVRRTTQRNIIVLGDFNAHNTTWGSPETDDRGEAVEEWAALCGLALLNRGSTDTWVRRQSGSIVDLTFASPALASRVSNWRVLDDVETLSDHRYVTFEVSTSSSDTTSRRDREARPSAFPRWSLVRLNEELLEEAAIVQAWTMQPVDPAEVHESAIKFRETLTRMCDAAMPRAKRRPSRRAVYWWTQDIADLREACVAARREFTRYRRLQTRSEEREDLLHNIYSQSKKTLQLAISRSKTLSRQEMLEDLNRDPWGRPYRAARCKFRPQAPPITETLQPQLLEEVVAGLFPDSPDHTPPIMADSLEEEEAEEVPPLRSQEIRAAALRLRAKNTAPGPDGVPGRVLALALDKLGAHLAELLDACLATGQFPTCWKEGRLVLLKKDGRPAEQPSAYRPIVLLDDTGKLFERIIASRIIQHLTSVGPNLSDNQFGFRESRSTIDAITRVKALSEEAVGSGGVLLAVSLDIANAFNSLPFGSIQEAIRFHRLPQYLRRLIDVYLHNRVVLYPGRDGSLHQRAVGCGVPQGSVLGPLLWNIGFDWTLRGDLPPGLSIVCYADDTLVTARGDDYEEAAALATAGVQRVVERIESLGLKVALNKTEALCFHGPRRGPPAGANIVIGGCRVEVKPQMKYLGLYLDPKWNFREHFRRLAPKLINAASALGRLLPNLGGPSVTCRRLYTGVVRSMALYGAPVWVGALTGPNKTMLFRAQRVMAVRVARGYRTISHEAACVLAGTPPWDLDAEVLAEVYVRCAEAKAQGDGPDPEDLDRWRKRAQRNLLRRWRQRLEEPCAGLRTVAAVRPVLKEWVNRRHGSLTFRLVQILSGHGSFGRYLCHIAGREPLAVCHHCACSDDTADHTLGVCPAWAQQRATLAAVVGNDLSLPAVVNAMVGSKRAWEAMVSFCEDVVAQKEAAERTREDDPLSAPIRRRRTGRRRGVFARQLLPIDASELDGKIGRNDVGKGEILSAQAQQFTGLHADSKFAGRTVAQPGSTTPEALQRPGLGACATRPCEGTKEGGGDFGRLIHSDRDRVPEIEKGRRLSVVLTRCDTPVTTTLASHEEESMDSDSSCASMVTVTSERSDLRRPFLKRNRSDPEAEDDDSAGSPLKGAAHKSKRGRGRPPSVGKYVGLAAAKAAYNAELAESLRLEAEAEVADVARNLREARASLQPSPPQPETEDQLTGAALTNVVRTSLETITMVATKSSQLKGTYVRALKDAVKGIQEAVSLLRSRSVTEEVARLEAANAQLVKEVADLRRDLHELRQRPAQPSEPGLRQLLEEVSRANVETFGTMINARLAGIEDRLLPEPRRRPPLAAEIRAARADPAHKEPAGAPAVSTSDGAPPASGQSKGQRVKKAGKVAGSQSSSAPPPPPVGKKGKKKKSMAAKEAAQARATGTSTPAEVPWTTVVGRKAKAKAAQAAKEQPKAQPTAQKKAKLRAPKTAAVTLTLLPGAEDRGVSYASILSDAKQRVRLADLNIESMRFRRAATGARMLEVSGEDSAEKADALASKLREVLSPEAVRVARPVKCAEIRVTDLDDSVDAIEVAEAIARDGGCPVDAIKYGRIVVGPRGDGALWLSCPVTAAKKVTDTGRVLVGWTSARVRLLAPRPIRCYRCLESGHLGAKCSCEVDRSKLCFRCGQPDHKARDCGAEPNCPVCAAAGKPAAHAIGGGGCISATKKPTATAPKKRSAPKSKRRKAKKAGEERMDTNP